MFTITIASSEFQFASYIQLQQTHLRHLSRCMVAS